MATTSPDLPLLYVTPPGWAKLALENPLALLNDHAHLEKKAASNALDLLLRWPEPNPPEKWIQAMTSIAIDEVGHLNTVTRILSRRGGRLTKSHKNAYAQALHQMMERDKGHSPGLLVDRMLVSALIEARSCERFLLLADHCPDKELAKLYRGLYLSEAGHYRVFVDLARQLPRAWGVEERWEELLAAEAAVARAQPPGSTMHSGVAGTSLEE